MTKMQINELERLIKQYNEKHSESKGDDISGALMFSHGISEQIKVFKKPKGRKIILKVDPKVIDVFY